MPSPNTASPIPARLRAIAAYLASRSIPLDPQAMLTHFEHYGVAEDLFDVEEDFSALVDRFAEAVSDDFLPMPAHQHQAMRLVRGALATLVERIETGRIDGRAAHLDAGGHGCILQILADAIDNPAWQTLRYDEDAPLLIERFIWHVQPGETHHTCPILALVRERTLRAFA